MLKDHVSIGLPIMMEEEGEKRAFLPDFVNNLVLLGFDVFLEHTYGNTLGYALDDYKHDHENIHFRERSEIFQKDIVLILRCPHEEDLDLVGKDSCLISMFHFPTRSKRVQQLQDRNIQAISLDSIKNDFGVRLVENMKAVAWNGVEAAFNELEEKWPHLIRGKQLPWNVLIMGTGMVGKHAVDAVSKFGKRSRNQKHIELGGEGAVAVAVGRNITYRPDAFKKLLNKADVLIDATQRNNPSSPILRNEELANLPTHAIIVDLSVDPYLTEDTPPVVKGIEGIPQGNLDQYVFHPHDPEWESTIPANIPTDERRKTVSCYSWPGIHPQDCMRHYGQQLLPLMRVLAKKKYTDISANGPFFERALYRAKLDTFVNSMK
ncbi:MAG TPA: alanine dehydrogenase [Anaerolineaceae bacterium]|nr:alanine dehydrogenase [Anaerolineaceae bacterium]